MKQKFEQVLAINVATMPAMQELSERPVIYSSHTPEFINLETNFIDALVVSIYEPISEDFLKRFTKLKYLGILGSSTKKIATQYCEDNNIKIKAVFDYCDHETAEWVILQILKFYREKKSPQSVYEKHLGLVGVGAVGKRLAQKALGLGLNVSFNAPHSPNELLEQGINFMPQKELFRTSDIISFHTPAHLSWLSIEHLREIRPHTLLINTCLGRISRDNNLEEFLAERLDINLIMDSIALASYPALKERSLSDTHSAYETSDSKQRLVDNFIGNMRDFLVTKKAKRNS